GAQAADDEERDFEEREEREERESGSEESSSREGEEGAAPSDADDFRAILQAELTADTIQHYLNRISVKPLLTVEEEQRYSRLAKAGEFEARQ
ncbi:sigma-70 factor domain-containing protein, partial [Cupriavidus sp. SIMBA_020]